MNMKRSLDSVHNMTLDGSSLPVMKIEMNDEVTYSNAGNCPSPGLSLNDIKDTMSKIESLGLEERKRAQDCLYWYTRIKHAMDKYGLDEIPESKLIDLARYMAWKDEHKWDPWLMNPILTVKK